MNILQTDSLEVLRSPLCEFFGEHLQIVHSAKHFLRPLEGPDVGAGSSAAEFVAKLEPTPLPWELTVGPFCKENMFV